MKPFTDITTKWKRFGVGTLTDHQYQVSLLPQDAASLQQLCERYPRMTQAEIIRDLLSAALRDLEQSLPYEPGKEVIALDELGD